MRPTVLRFGAALILLLTCLGGLAAAEGRTMKGEYRWSGSGDSGPLEAVFTPTGEGTWNVDFRFTHGGQRRVYSGTAEGSLSGGELRGKVSNEDRGRQFTFHMKFEDGRLRGTHAEITGGHEESTGTLSLG